MAGHDGEPCASCGRRIEEDEVIFQMESADILCKECGDQLGDELKDEIAKHVPLNEVHEDWRTT